MRYEDEVELDRAFAEQERAHYAELERRRDEEMDVAYSEYLSGMEKQGSDPTAMLAYVLIFMLLFAIGLIAAASWWLL